MKAELFSDNLYHDQNHLEFDPVQVVAAEERVERLFLRGQHAITQILLKNGTQYLLRGALKAQIKAARHTSSAP